MNFIVTADDFGMSSSVNGAIVRAIALGHASHTSVLATSDGLEAASELARSNGFADRVGLHLDLSWGVPLTDAVRRSSRFCRDGRFTPLSRGRTLVPLSGDERRAIAGEVGAQIERARRCGLAIRHLDSHQHSHIAPNIATVVAAAAKALSIERVRLARVVPQASLVSGVFKRCYNGWLRRRGLTTMSHFGTVDELIDLAERGRLTGPFEAMIHPTLDDRHVVIDAASLRPLDELLAPLASLGSRL